MPSANLADGSVRRIVTVSIALIVIIASLATGLTAGVSTAQQEVTVASSEVTCYEEDGTLWEDYSYTLSEPHWIHQQFVVIDARTGEEIDTAQTLVGDVAGEERDGVDGREDLGQYAQDYNDGEPVVLDVVITDAESGEQIDRLEAPQECYDMSIERFGEEQPTADDDQPATDGEDNDRDPLLVDLSADEGNTVHQCAGALIFEFGPPFPLMTTSEEEESLEDSSLVTKHCGELLSDTNNAIIEALNDIIEEDDDIQEEFPGGTEIPEENEPIIDPDGPQITAPEAEVSEEESDEN